MTQLTCKVDLERYIRDIPDFPKEGIVFKDISTLVKDKNAFQYAIDFMFDEIQGKDIDVVVGVEARGFIFASVLAYKLGCGFVPIRKKGKLPYKTKAVTYDLEYGTDTLEIHEDAIEEGQKVLIVDDLLATGGTVKAACDLIQGFGAEIVSILFLIELSFLKGQEKLTEFDTVSLITY